MTPPCHSFPATALPQMVQQDVRGRRRKLPETDDASGSGSVRGGRVDLAACELLRMLQYKCEVERPLSAESPVRCFPVDRWFRRCQDRNGSFMVETTAWEEMQPARFSEPDSHDALAKPGGPSSDNASARPERKPLQWSTQWTESDTRP